MNHGAPIGIHALAAATRGWLSRSEGDLLYTLARECHAGCIVEIGSFEGKSTTYLASGSMAGSHVPIYSIDPHEEGTLPAFRQQLARAKIEHLVNPIVSASQRIADSFDRPIGLLFIDGAHDDLSVRQDWEQWVPKVLPGGYVAMHDTLKWPAPRVIAEKRLLRSAEFIETGVADSITFGRKRRSSDPEQRRLERYRVLTLKQICNIGAQLPLPEFAKGFASRTLRSLQH